MSKVFTASKTMAGARQICPDEGFQRLTPRRDKLNALSRQWEARRQAKIDAEREAVAVRQVMPVATIIPRTPVQHIISDIAHQHGLTPADILSPCRRRHFVKARHEAMWAVKDARPCMSLPEMGRQFGGRDHTTVIHALLKRGL